MTSSRAEFEAFLWKQAGINFFLNDQKTNIAFFYNCKRRVSAIFHLYLFLTDIISILKIDLEIAEIIEVKISTCNTKINFWSLCKSKMSISK